jgi:hypothetical protein
MYQLQITTIAGSIISFDCLEFKPVELGGLYIAEDCLIYEVSKQDKDLVDNFVKRSSYLTFFTDEMKDSFASRLPMTTMLYQSIDNYYVIVSKDPNFICLDDINNHFNEEIDPKHIAWIISGLLDISCYLYASRLMHGDINLTSVYINPANHQVALLGDWWYACDTDEKMIALPSRSFSSLPSDIITTTKASNQLDRILIKKLARELLSKNKISSVLNNWAHENSDIDPMSEYTHWMNVILPSAFGPRKFHELKLTSTDIYN